MQKTDLHVGMHMPPIPAPRSPTRPSYANDQWIRASPKGAHDLRPAVRFLSFLDAF